MTAPLAPLMHFLSPWQSLMSDSAVAATAVTAVHLLSMLFGGGFAVAADRATLRTPAADRSGAHRQLRRLEAVHRPVMIAIGVLVASGVALAAADLDTFIVSPVFYIKLGLVGLLLLNGLVLRGTERSLLRLGAGAGGETVDPDWRRLWSRLRFASWCSLLLWSGTLVVGAALTNVA